jgi:ubiquinone/menaquinone biosynthesis C-methylase UbiE
LRFYQNQILPRLIHVAMRQRDHEPYRARVRFKASGRVLEIGIGSRLNLPFYGPDVTEIIGLDPSPELLAMAQRQAARARAIPVQLLEGSAGAIPMQDRSLDTVVTTWTLCSIPDAEGALAEMRRVRKPSGSLLFVEHGRAPDRGPWWWQDRLTPLWKHVAGGCHLHRSIAELIANSGFWIYRLENNYMRGPKALEFIYEGRAQPA